jgi:putative tryptophan/tyrosine transport system substrate-binding protein
MDRRTFMGAAVANLVAVSLAAIAQQTAKVPHIGYMSTGSLKINGAFLEAFQDGLRELGYVDGKNIAIDVRWAGDMVSAFPQLAASLVQDNPSAIITTCIPSTRAAKGATQTIPVVMSVDGDPVRAGLIASYARPGGNVTGTATLFEELIPKWLEFLTVALPKARSIAILTNPDDLIDPFYWGQSEDAAKRLGVKVLHFEASSPADIDRAFTEMKRQDAEGLVVMIEAFLVGQMRRIIQLADRDKLPAIYGFREFTDAGGLMSYGLSYREYYRRMARYVDAVLKGTKPADLPVEQPTKIELVINLKTAKALGLTIPQPLLLRADEVIQ